MLRASGATVQLALRRFKEEQGRSGIFKRKRGYEEIVKRFVASGNKVNFHDIARVESSRYAIPLPLLCQIEGETTMSWTGFVLEMRDGRCFPFGTTFLMEFFDLPEDYTFVDVTRVHNHSYVSKSGEVKSLREGFTNAPDDYDPESVFREKPYFVCYTDA
jgi:hypothetical protein